MTPLQLHELARKARAAKAKPRRKKTPVERYYRRVWASRIPVNDFAQIAADMTARGIAWRDEPNRADVQFFFGTTDNFYAIFAESAP